MQVVALMAPALIGRRRMSDCTASTGAPSVRASMRRRHASL